MIWKRFCKLMATFTGSSSMLNPISGKTSCVCCLTGRGSKEVLHVNNYPAFTLPNIHSSASNISDWLKQQMKQVFCFFFYVWFVCQDWPGLASVSLFPCCYSFLKIACLLCLPPPPTAWLLSPTFSWAERMASAGTVLFTLKKYSLKHVSFLKYLLHDGSLAKDLSLFLMIKL